MDGVLIDANAVIERAWREAAGLFGREVSDRDVRDHIHGCPGSHTIAALFSDLARSDQERVQAHVMHIENTADYAPIPGVARTIAELSDAGVTLGIVTSGWRSKIERVVRLLDAEDRFSVYVEREDVSRGKPHPDPYLLAAERLGIAASSTIVFEDSGSGVRSAAAAGAYCVGIGAEELLSQGASVVIPNFAGVGIRVSGRIVTLSFVARHELLIGAQSAGG